MFHIFKTLKREFVFKNYFQRYKTLFVESDKGAGNANGYIAYICFGMENT